MQGGAPLKLAGEVPLHGFVMHPDASKQSTWVPPREQAMALDWLALQAFFLQHCAKHCLLEPLSALVMSRYLDPVVCSIMSCLASSYNPAMRAYTPRLLAVQHLLRVSRPVGLHVIAPCTHLGSAQLAHLRWPRSQRHELTLPHGVLLQMLDPLASWCAVEDLEAWVVGEGLPLEGEIQFVVRSALVDCWQNIEQLEARQQGPVLMHLTADCLGECSTSLLSLLLHLAAPSAHSTATLPSVGCMQPLPWAYLLSYY